MKNKFFYLLLFLATTLTLPSCSKDKDEEPFITATVDGVSFEASSIIALGDDSLGGLIVFISGRNSDNSMAIGLNIPADTEIGIPTVVDEFDLGLLYTDAEDNAFITVGTLTLDKHDTDKKVMEGTFSFTATQDDEETNVVEITNGSFRVEYF